MILCYSCSLLKNKQTQHLNEYKTLYFALITHKHRTYSQVKHGLLTLQWSDHQEAQQADLPNISCLTGWMCTMQPCREEGSQGLGGHWWLQEHLEGASRLLHQEEGAQGLGGS